MTLVMFVITNSGMQPIILVLLSPNGNDSCVKGLVSSPPVARWVRNEALATWNLRTAFSSSGSVRAAFTDRYFFIAETKEQSVWRSVRRREEGGEGHRWLTRLKHHLDCLCIGRRRVALINLLQPIHLSIQIDKPATSHSQGCSEGGRERV